MAQTRSDTVSGLDLPSWFHSGIKGTMVVRCVDSPAAPRFTVAEMGCLTGGIDHHYSMGFNRRMLELARAARPDE